MDESGSAVEFDFDSGALCLDFANTVEWHASENPVDSLSGYADLLAWGEAADIVSPERSGKLRELLVSQPNQGAAAFERAVRLREAIYRIFANLAEERDASPEDLGIFNATLKEALSHLRITPTSQGFDWEWIGGSASLDEISWPVARSAAELLTSDTLDRVSQCADDRGCGYLFIDTSRNHSRRWCSMESCGNRAKVRRHYKRQRKREQQKCT